MKNIYILALEYKSRRIKFQLRAQTVSVVGEMGPYLPAPPLTMPYSHRKRLANIYMPS